MLAKTIYETKSLLLDKNIIDVAQIDEKHEKHSSKISILFTSHSNNKFRLNKNLIVYNVL